MLDWTTCGGVERHTGRVSGAWVFRRTRVPASALFANLEGGATVWITILPRRFANRVEAAEVVASIGPSVCVELEIPRSE